MRTRYATAYFGRASTANILAMRCSGDCRPCTLNVLSFRSVSSSTHWKFCRGSSGFGFGGCPMSSHDAFQCSGLTFRLVSRLAPWTLILEGPKDRTYSGLQRAVSPPKTSEQYQDPSCEVSTCGADSNQGSDLPPRSLSDDSRGQKTEILPTHSQQNPDGPALPKRRHDEAALTLGDNNVIYRRRPISRPH